MRWDGLFDDLEAQLASSDRLGLESEIDERSRVDDAGVELADRLRGSLGLHVGVHLACGAAFEGALSHVGCQSLVLNEQRHQVLIPYAGILRYQGLGRFALAEPSTIRKTLGLASSLRVLARDRSGLTVLLARGSSGETTLNGVIDRVGRDYFDLAVTHAGDSRRASNVRQVATVPLAALGALRSVLATGM